MRLRHDENRKKMEIREQEKLEEGSERLFSDTRKFCTNTNRIHIGDFEGTRHIVLLVFPSRSLVFLFPFTSVQSRRFTL